MSKDPLFVRFLNGEVNAVSIIESFLQFTHHKKSQEIAENAIQNPPDISLFKKDFRNAVKDIMDSGLNNFFINYVNNYMKPSLLEVVDGSGGNDQRRQILIKSEDTPWVEAIVCYNLSLYIGVYGVGEIKQCPTCQKFFTNKGKYAKYCSDPCKKSGK